jgi:hypothetical protein
MTCRVGESHGRLDKVTREIGSHLSAIMNIFRNRPYTLLALSFTRADQSRSDRKGLALVSRLHLHCFLLDQR